MIISHTCNMFSHHRIQLYSHRQTYFQSLDRRQSTSKFDCTERDSVIMKTSRKSFTVSRFILTWFLVGGSVCCCRAQGNCVVTYNIAGNLSIANIIVFVKCDRIWKMCIVYTFSISTYDSHNLYRMTDSQVWKLSGITELLYLFIIPESFKSVFH